jgi:transglutaminase-like putative cysteine protease
MQFHIKHTTRYTYSRTVFCEPFTVRLRPREDIAQRLLRYQLAIDPTPLGISDYLDFEGNISTQCWFNGPTCTLTLTINSLVETLRTNPFDFLLESFAIRLPFEYRPEVAAVLAPYRKPAQGDGPVAQLASEIRAASDQSTVVFLTSLAKWIAENCERTIRPQGDPLPAETTLRRRQGSCRDLAVLFAETCRTLGLAARFVSGYQAHPEDDGHRHLHAWAEVYLPGAGWRGFDPGQGLAVADQHVAVAAGLSPLAAAPTAGTFRGTGATSTMETQIVVRVSDGTSTAGQIQSATQQQSAVLKRA